MKTLSELGIGLVQWAWTLFVALSVSFALPIVARADGLSAPEAMRLVREANAMFVDVREWDEIEGGIVSGAFWLPSSTLQKMPEAGNKLLALLPKDRELLIYCRSGARSKRAVSFLVSRGYRAKNIGGFANLKAAGLKTSVPQYDDETAFIRELQIDSYLQSLNSMREGLASTLEKPAAEITESDFARVCAPVGKALVAWAKENSCEARQVALKYRNPKYAPNPQEAATLKVMESDPSVRKIVERSKREKSNGVLVSIRIPVAQSCLKCHGAPEARPAFIKRKYPGDKAHGFRTGDLRGMYSVFVPDSQPVSQKE